MARKHGFWRVVPRGFPTAALSQGVGGDILSLFRNGEDGFVFGPFDSFERLFLLSSGSTGNVAANDDPVGLNLDRHSWNGASLTAIIAAATELIPNPNFSGAVAGTPGTRPTGWGGLLQGAANVAPASIALNTVGGTSVIDFAFAGTASSTGGQVGFFGPAGVSAIPVTPGKTYRASVQLALLSGTQGDNNSTAAFRIQFLDAAASNISNVDVTLGAISSSLQTYTIMGVAPANAAFAYVGYRVGFTSASVYSWTVRISPPSFKLLPGNHALQATTTKRPLWKANSGKPYLNFDGTDDFVQQVYVPGAAGTVAVAFNAANLDAIALGGGTATGNKRLRVGLANTSGRPRIVFNDSTDQNIGANVDRRSTDVLIALTWDATGWAAYLDGAASPTGSAATVPNHDGAGSGFALGSLESGGSNFMNGRCYAALARSVRSTPSEIALINSQFQRTYQ